MSPINYLAVFAVALTSSSSASTLLGFGSSVSWHEEVLLHNGIKIAASRWQSYGGRHEIGQTPPIKEQEISFVMPETGERVSWKTDYGEELGRSNFKLLALHILNNEPYIVALPNLCLSYNKWGRPNPPYVAFKYERKDWKRIPLQDLPTEFTNLNLVIETKGEEKVLTAQPLVSAELVKKLNSQLRQPEFRSLLRVEIKPGSDGSLVNCEKLVFYKGAWVGPGDSIGKRMMDLKSK